MHRCWPIVVPLAATTLAYRQITRTYFYADDFVALYAFANGTGEEWVTTSSGGHLLLVRNLVVALLWNLFEIDPRPYFRLALAAHLAVTALLFAIVRGSTGSALAAAIVATAWGTCALAGGTLSWMSAHGHAFAALAAVAALASMLAHARRDGPVSGWLSLGWGVLLLAGAMCFGTGLGVALLYPVLLVVIFSRARLGLAARAIGLAVPALTLALYVSAPVTDVGTHHRGAYATASHMLLRVSRLPHLAPYFGHLVWTGASSLVLGPAWDDEQHPDAASAVAAVLVGLGLLGGWRAATPRTRRALLAGLLVMAGAYGAITIGRGGVHDPAAVNEGYSVAAAAAITRYHYEGPLGLAIALGIALGAMLERAQRPRTAATAAAALALGVLVIAVTLAPPTPPDRIEARRAAASLVDRIRRVVASAPERIVRLPNGSWPGGGAVLHLLPDRFPGIAAAFITYFPTNEVDGHLVRFESDDPRYLPALAGGGRIVETLVVRPRRRD